MARHRASRRKKSTPHVRTRDDDYYSLANTLPHAVREVSRELRLVPTAEETAAFLDIDPTIVEEELDKQAGMRWDTYLFDNALALIARGITSAEFRTQFGGRPVMRILDRFFPDLLLEARTEGKSRSVPLWTSLVSETPKLDQAIEEAVQDLRRLSRAGLPAAEREAYLQTVGDLLRDGDAAPEHVRIEEIRLVAVLVDNAWRAALDQPEAEQPRRSVASVAGGASLAAVSIIGTVVTLATANVSLAILAALTFLVLIVATVAGLWAWSHIPRRKGRGAS